MAYHKEFHEKYRLLVQLKREFGHTNIPSKPGKAWLKNLSVTKQEKLKQVGRFVETLRKQYKSKELANYKIDMLNHIGFDWIPPSKQENYLRWKRLLEKLTAFKQTYGHCNVPEGWEKDVELANFVISSRICKKKDKLSNYKIDTLNDLGFEWEVSYMDKKRDEKGKYVSLLDVKYTDHEKSHP